MPSSCKTPLSEEIIYSIKSISLNASPKNNRLTTTPIQSMRSFLWNYWSVESQRSLNHTGYYCRSCLPTEIKDKTLFLKQPWILDRRFEAESELMDQLLQYWTALCKLSKGGEKESIFLPRCDAYGLKQWPLQQSSLHVSSGTCISPVAKSYLIALKVHSTRKKSWLIV